MKTDERLWERLRCDRRWPYVNRTWLDAPYACLQERCEVLITSPHPETAKCEP